MLTVELLRLSNASQDLPLNPSKLKEIMAMYHPQYAPNLQQCAHEFLGLVLRKLKEESLYWKELANDNRTVPVDDHFKIEKKLRGKCSSCNGEW